ncbi:AfsR/SARP family transcriptional regulator [Aminipila luticellarii]|nr:BTAD domain-containing putative transcriptional regulator [Aminipila luticellarii]
MLNLYFLGRARIEYNGKSVVENFRNKTIALICLLIINQDKYLSRERILGYLWPDSSEEAAKNNLRYNLWLIKKNIGKSESNEEFLFIDKELCGVNAEYDFQCDILDIMNFKPQQSDSIERLLKLKNMFEGEFLEGCYYNNCEDFNEVIIFQRTRLENFKVQILKRLTELYEKESKMEECLNVLEEILDIDPYDEEVALKIIILYMKIGKRGAGVLFYNSFRDRLASRLGIQPSEKLRNKFAELKQSQGSECQPQEPKVIQIQTICIKDIQYFWMADVVGKLVGQKRVMCEKVLNENMINALGYIQPAVFNDVQTEKNMEIPDVQIVNAFIHLILNICEEHKLEIFITEMENMDSVSVGVLKYLKNSGISKLSIHEH